MLVILEKVVLAILLLFFGAVTVTNPWGLDAIQRVTLALAAFLAMICVAYTINKNKIELPPSSVKSLPAPELPKKDETKKIEPEHHSPTVPKPMPKPVLYWEGFNSHHAITPDFYKVPTAEETGGRIGHLTLYIRNEGNAELTKAKLYIKNEPQYDVVPDKSYETLSQSLERTQYIREISIEIPYIRPNGEPFRFTLTINHPVVTMNLYLRIDGDQIPEGVGFPGLQVLHGREPQPAAQSPQ